MRTSVSVKAKPVTPKILSIVLAVFFSIGFFYLSYWQIQRAQYKYSLQSQYQKQTTQSLTNPSALILSQSNYDFYTVSLAGSLDLAHIFLLDNQIQQHQPGHHVLVPMTTPNQLNILLNLGWISRYASTAQLNQFIKAKTSSPFFTGKLYRPQGKPLLLKSSANLSTGWPKTMQVLDIKIISEQLAKPFSAYLAYHPTAYSNKFSRSQFTGNLNPYRHISYAIQFFIFGMLIIIFYVRIAKK